MASVEVRPNSDGTVDELLVFDDAGKCVFHLEQMSEQGYWMAAYTETSTVHVNLFAEYGETEDGGEIRGPVIGSNYEIEPPMPEREAHP